MNVQEDRAREKKKAVKRVREIEGGGGRRGRWQGELTFGGKKCESRDEKKKRGWRLIERMKEERVNRKDGALEETDKDLREQMRGEKRWR